MEQTAIQELITEMEQLKETKLYTGSFKAIEDCLSLAYAKLEKEKIHIVEAWNSAYGGDSNYVGEQYYNETFKQQ